MRPLKVHGFERFSVVYVSGSRKKLCEHCKRFSLTRNKKNLTFLTFREEILDCFLI